MDIPVYLFAGFLEGGKTTFINGILQDGFALRDRTLLICCEEGTEEYDLKVLKNITVQIYRLDIILPNIIIFGNI